MVSRSCMCWPLPAAPDRQMPCPARRLHWRLPAIAILQGRAERLWAERLLPYTLNAFVWRPRGEVWETALPGRP
ncbi:unnamed protein product [Zymoseptoria tritici ST99CH_1E4]|uniref:Uncharacterized protein n=1 Tax=Zymoseptoria tritici ST99CH_1E4 TaxID=1276532 RepID=A0A2H1GI09_ZYMTR|nr:unnamed protein product [Zymoseptoria tritici ST99CH_1E4]